MPKELDPNRSFIDRLFLREIDQLLTEYD